MNSSYWSTLSALDYCQTVTDGTHDSPKPAPSGKYLITSRHLGRYALDYDNAYLISNEDFERINLRSKVEQWDVVFRMIGTVGLVYREKRERIDYAIKNVGLFKLGRDKIKSDWLYYYLQSPKAREYVEKHKRGTTQQYLPLSSLRSFPIEVPPVEVQRVVTQIFSTLDDKIECNRRTVRVLEDMSNNLFKRWFTDFEFPNENGDPYRSAGGKMVDSEFGEIPEGWRTGAYTDLVSIAGGGTPSTKNDRYWDGEIPFYTPKDHCGSYFVLSTQKTLTEEGLSKCSSPLYAAGTVFVTARGTVGKVCLAGRPMAMNQSCYALKGRGCGSPYVHQLTLSSINILQARANGAVFDAIVTRDFDQLAVPIPPRGLISRFVDAVQPLYDAMLDNNKERYILSQLRDALLPKLISGEFSMPIDADDGAQAAVISDTSIEA